MILLESSIIDSLATNSYIILLASFLTIIGVIISIIFYFKAKKEKKPIFITNSSTIIDGINKTIPDLNILFKNMKVETLTITSINFLNEGKMMIDGNDIHTVKDKYRADKILFTISDKYKILQARYSNVKNEDNDYHISYNDKYVEFNFNNVGYKEGCTIEIIHTGLNNSIKINGTIKSYGPITFNKNPTRFNYLQIGIISIIFSTLVIIFNNGIFRTIIITTYLSSLLTILILDRAKKLND